MSDGKAFALPLRVLHWTMVVLIFLMLGLGVAMVTSLANYNALVSFHRPVGILILLLVAVRLLVRLMKGSPPLPGDMPSWQRQIAHASHWVLYSLMFALPIVGWAMLSAAAYPVVLFGPIELPPIVPQSVVLFSLLRTLHTVLAFALFGTVLAHASAALIHGLIFRNGVFSSMVLRREVARKQLR